MLNEFYMQRKQERNILINVLQSLYSKKQYFDEARKRLKGTVLMNFINGIFYAETYHGLEKSILFDSCFIHGDLHCDNVMYGKNMVFIDFAHAKNGPIAFDIIKIFNDILFRIKEYQSQPYAGWKGSSITHSLCDKLFELFKVSDNIIPLLDILISLEFAKALSYTQIDDNTKKWIVDYLCRYDPFSSISKLTP
jgi:thiamine kinase-like enzyme